MDVVDPSLPSSPSRSSSPSMAATARTTGSCLQRATHPDPARHHIARLQPFPRSEVPVACAAFLHNTGWVFSLLF